jgi:hypothetical protein
MAGARGMMMLIQQPCCVCVCVWQIWSEKELEQGSGGKVVLQGRWLGEKVLQLFTRTPPRLPSLPRRRDSYERAELSCGTYEVVATPEYSVRPPMPVTHVFLVDVGHAAVASGATAAACMCIEQVLDAVQGA